MGGGVKSSPRPVLLPEKGSKVFHHDPVSKNNFSVIADIIKVVLNGFDGLGETVALDTEFIGSVFANRGGGIIKVHNLSLSFLSQSTRIVY